MTADDALVAMIGALERVGSPYFLVGSLATNFHGIPRSTRDADIVVAIDESTLDRLAAALVPELRIQPQTSFETVTGTIRHIIEVQESPFIIELFGCSDDPHDRARLARRQRVRVLDHHAWVLTVEDVVITKLRWGQHANRSKDLDDARNVLAVRHGDLDMAYIRRWCAEHGTTATLDRLLSQSI
jgi:hypothetical protein